jgi:hypothetical protein
MAEAIREYQEFYYMAVANRRDIGGKKAHFVEKQYIGSYNRSWAKHFQPKFDEKFGNSHHLTG